MNTYCEGGANPTTLESCVKVMTGEATDYNNLRNKPRINGVELVGDKTNEEILIQSISNEDLEKILK